MTELIAREGFIDRVAEAESVDQLERITAEKERASGQTRPDYVRDGLAELRQMEEEVVSPGLGLATKAEEF